MSPRLLKTLAALTGVAVFTAGADDTNVFYIPLDRSGQFRDAAAVAESAKRRPEGRPAELDPEGHWGKIAAGLQLGLRFSTNTFLIGEAVDATVIVRNTATNVLNVPFANMDSIEIFVRKDGKPAPAHIPPWLFGSRGRPVLPLPPRNQLEHPGYALNQAFDLSSPGVYEVFAQCRKSVLAPDLPEIKSGTPEITVL